MRIGLVAPPWAPVPPTAYGGTEAVIDRLARGLARWGHDGLDVDTVSYSGEAGILPSTRSCQPDRNRVSRKNKPCGSPGTMSPPRAEMENDGPSTKVTVWASMPSATGCSA